MKGLHLCYSYLVKLYICILSICELNLCALSTLRRCKCCLLLHRTLTYFIRVSITVWLTSCLTGLDLTKLKNIYIIKHKQSNWILSSQTGGQPYSDTSPDEVSECSKCLHTLYIGFVETFLSLWHIFWYQTTTIGSSYSVKLSCKCTTLFLDRCPPF